MSRNNIGAGVLSYGALAVSLSGRGHGDHSGTCCAHDRPAENSSRTSRRRRLWELPDRYHCPIVGVCFDVAELRQMMNKYLKYPPETTDYMWHTIAVGVCNTRCSLSEKMNRTLDQRFAPMIRTMSACKTPAELRESWREVCRLGVEIPAGLWAACTHPVCDEELEQEIHSDIHMIQHQVGAGVRIDLKAMKALRAENEQLRIELETLRKRHEQQRQEQAQAIQQLSQKVASLHADLSVRGTSLRRAERELDRVRALLPDLDDRERLLARLKETEARLLAARDREQELEREVVRLRDFATFAEETIEVLSQNPVPEADDGGLDPACAEALLGKCVLCVGGRSGSVNSYREVIEQYGGRFVHHDGGREESLHRIDGALAAADIVICQVGCISHNAYWRVKEQCKRTGKPCMFVKSTGVSSLGQIVSDVARKSGEAEGDGDGAKGTSLEN